MTTLDSQSNAVALHRCDTPLHQEPESPEWYQMSCINGRLFAHLCQPCPDDYCCYSCTQPVQLLQCFYKKEREGVECLNNCLIPARYKEATVAVLQDMLENKKTTGTIARAVQWLLKWSVTAPLPQKGILLSSRPGTGKSFALAALLRYLTLHRTQSCRFLEFDHFLMELKQCYHYKKDEYKLYDSIRNVDVLVIDDLGSHRDSEWASDVMQRIIGYRYNDDKSVLISTNMEVKQQMKQEIPAHTYSRLKPAWAHRRKPKHCVINFAYQMKSHVLICVGLLVEFPDCLFCTFSSIG